LHVDACGNAPADASRRRAVVLPLALGAAAWAGTVQAESQSTDDSASAPAANAPAVPEGQRLALVIGNREYPNPFNLPPAYKNVRDVSEALSKRGFSVTSVVDEDPARLKSSIVGFMKMVESVGPTATVLFYFTGHGMQVDAENLMLGAGIAPNSKEDVLLDSSLRLRRDVVDLLPHRPDGLTIAVIDACRQPVRAAQSAVLVGTGFNQVEAPLGCLIAFSTGAGKPAIAPADENLNTFYTASLVKILLTAPGELSFSELFRLVKIDVQQTMMNHPLAAIRAVAQVPFIAENTRGRFMLSARANEPRKPRFSAEDEAALWTQLQASQWPADIHRLSQEYLQRYPASHLAGGAEVARQGASEAMEALRSNGVRLYRSSFHPAAASPELIAELRKCARGDKDAAARVARMYKTGDANTPPDPNRYEGWLQFAAALGNGIASYELAVHYRRQGQPAPAAQYEARARELAYTPPPTLDNYRK